MNVQEKISMLEELMDLDEGTLMTETVLSEIEEYDSMAKLSLIVMMEDEFGVKLTSQEVKAFETVGDIIARMN